MWEPAGKTTISTALHQSGVHGSVARWEPLLSFDWLMTRLEFAKQHVKDSESMTKRLSGLI